MASTQEGAEWHVCFFRPTGVVLICCKRCCHAQIFGRTALHWVLDPVHWPVYPLSPLIHVLVGLCLTLPEDCDTSTCLSSVTHGVQSVYLCERVLSIGEMHRVQGTKHLCQAAKRPSAALASLVSRPPLPCSPPLPGAAALVYTDPALATRTRSERRPGIYWGWG